MFYRVFTGVYKDRFITVKKYIKSWDLKIKEVKSSKVVYVVPADKSLYIKETTELQNISEIKNYYDLVLKEKFTENIIYDIYFKKPVVEILVLKDFSLNPSYYMLDSEILSLQRVFNFLTDEDGYVFNIEKDKITFLSIKNKEIDVYRVLRCDLDEVLNQIPPLEKGKFVLLSGDYRLNEFKTFLTDFKILQNPYCDESKTVAFGGSLKGILNDRRLSFVKERLTQKEVKDYLKLAVIVLGLYLGSFLFMDKIFKDKINQIKALQSAEFKKYFPDVPVVSPYMQVKSMASTDTNFDLSEKLSKINLPKNSKIYSVEYYDGILYLKGESSEPPQVAKSVKKTPSGNFEFEIEVK